jgi:EPS-associated MarR family transcriptional regulator
MPGNTQNDLEYDYRLLRIIEQEPSLTQRELAERVGLSVRKTNYVLGALIDRGLVKAENFRRNKYKAGYIYLLTPKGISEKVSITARFLKRKMDEFDRLKAEIEEIKGDLGYRRCVYRSDTIYYRVQPSGVEIMAILGGQDLDEWL